MFEELQKLSDEADSARKQYEERKSSLNTLQKKARALLGFPVFQMPNFPGVSKNKLFVLALGIPAALIVSYLSLPIAVLFAGMTALHYWWADRG